MFPLRLVTLTHDFCESKIKKKQDEASNNFKAYGITNESFQLIFKRE